VTNEEIIARRLHDEGVIDRRLVSCFVCLLRCLYRDLFSGHFSLVLIAKQYICFRFFFSSIIYFSWNCICLQEGRTPLIEASCENNVEEVKALIKFGANVNATELDVRANPLSISMFSKTL
jgi:hypothetical protein